MGVHIFQDEKKYERRYSSEREIELVSNSPGVVTVEDYTKWYHLYYIEEDGTVKTLDDKIGKDVYDIDMMDHCYYPDSLVEFLIKHNLKIEYISYIAVCHMCLEDAYEDYIPDDRLPTKEDLEKVLYDSSNDEYVSVCFNFYIFRQFTPFETAFLYTKQQ